MVIVTSIPTSLDMNECISGTANCDPNADCFNIPGSFVCVCRAGFIGDGFTCSPIRDPCGPGFVLSGNMCIGECRYRTFGNFISIIYTIVTVDVNECASGTDNCDADATCSNIPGSFICVCNPGFSGDGVTCIELVPCGEHLDL